MNKQVDFTRYINRMLELYPGKYEGFTFNPSKQRWEKDVKVVICVVDEEPEATPIVIDEPVVCECQEKPPEEKKKKKRKKSKPHTNKEVRNDVLARDNYTCQECGTKGKLHVHHIKHRKNGGRDELNNLVTLCPICHAYKHKDEPVFKIMLKSIEKLG